MTNEESLRLDQLRRRWEADPTSRVFLQLAEEYRRSQNLDEAARVLTRGLEHYPTSGAAQVALGRCQLELGRVEEAVETLQNVTRADPTQMVANRLLVDGYLRLHDIESARQTLELYTELNPLDPELEGLEQQLSELALTVGAPSVPQGSQMEPSSTSGLLVSPAPILPEPDLLNLRPPVRLREAQFEPETAKVPTSAAPSSTRLTSANASSQPVGTSAGFLPSTEGLIPSEPEFAGQLPLRPTEPLPAEISAPETVASLTVEPGTGTPDEASESPEDAGEGMREPESESVPVEPLWTSIEASEQPEITPDVEVPRPRAMPATSTLGQLYREQGHEEEAREIYERVGGTRPSPLPEDERGLEGAPPTEPDGSGPDRTFLPATMGLSERKILALRRYLGELQEARHDRLT